ncbi:MAG TPA: hypothetical protein VKB57_00055 [Acidimicrobiales bacterium]|nr:hypothetical protein [Acidimicrobiales bacterium]
METLYDENASAPKGTGWISFAAALLVVSGIFKIFDALWAFKYDDEVNKEVQTVLFERDLTSWGWVWLVVGIILILAGVAVTRGSQWARWLGIVVASLAAISFLPWIYFQPLWTILSVTLAILVVYALCTYGGRTGPAARAAA